MPFWYTESYQEAVRLLKEAYILRSNKDQTDKDRKEEANNLINYNSSNFFGETSETETKRKLQGSV